MPDDLSALICLSQFKNHLTNVEATHTVATALDRLGIVSQELPIGDGGAGTVAAVQAALGGELENVACQGPTGRRALSRVLCLPDATRPESVYLESADTCGLSRGDRDALHASSFGLGELLSKCLERWRPSLGKVYVGLGDSATSDAGMGMLSALGYTFLDESQRPLVGNASNLSLVRAVKVPPPATTDGVTFTVLCDVSNPLCGPNGSARVFSPQKGADAEAVRRIERGMESFADIIESHAGRRIRSLPHTGAAGGLASAFLLFLQAELVPGARFLFDWIRFDTRLEEHTFLVTGEGRTDAQTLAGKAPYECIERAAKLGRRAVVISGSLAPGLEALAQRAALFSCGSTPTARDALYRRTIEIFSDVELLATLKA